MAGEFDVGFWLGVFLMMLAVAVILLVVTSLLSE